MAQSAVPVPAEEVADAVRHGDLRRALVAGGLPVRIEVDRERCAGSGMCALTDPVVFDQDEADGTVVLLRASPPGGHEKSAREAAHLCPTGAIRVLE